MHQKLLINKDLRKSIVNMVTKSGEGHIPSAFSVVDIINCLYENHLKFRADEPGWDDRDYFVLSKGHGATALFVVLEKFGFFSSNCLDRYGTFDGILGGHPDTTKVPGVEASTGSLGHGLPISIGLTLADRIRQNKGRTYVLVGDGECNEGTIWESALVANNLKLNSLCCIVDYNLSSDQVLPHNDLPKQWQAFGWNVYEVDGHNNDELNKVFTLFRNYKGDKPTVVVAHTVKGKGVDFLEGHGLWHHKVPDHKEYKRIMEVLR